jgi:hypothetical protein
MVICTVPDEAALRRWADQTALQGIRNYLFEEDDFGDEATAFCTEPITGEARRFFRKLPLWAPEYEGAI